MTVWLDCHFLQKVHNVYIFFSNFSQIALVIFSLTQYAQLLKQFCHRHRKCTDQKRRHLLRRSLLRSEDPFHGHINRTSAIRAAAGIKYSLRAVYRSYARSAACRNPGSVRNHVPSENYDHPSGMLRRKKLSPSE